MVMLSGTHVVVVLLCSTRRHHREREFGSLRQGVDEVGLFGMLGCNARLHVNMKWMDRSFVRVFMDEDETCCDLVDQL